jgi:hypothetical protein
MYLVLLVLLKNIKNTDGYKKDRTVYYFSTLHILDKEPNGSKEYANDIDSVKDPAEENGITFAGVLDHKSGVTEAGQQIYDIMDYYTLKLKAADTILITVTNREPLTISVERPSGITNAEFQAAKGKSNDFTYIVGMEHLLEDPVTAYDLVPFYINLSDNTANSPPNPYKINIKVKRKK